MFKTDKIQIKYIQGVDYNDMISQFDDYVKNILTPAKAIVYDIISTSSFGLIIIHEII